MRYAFIQDHQSDWPVVVQCDVLAVSRSGFYAWRRREPSATARRRAELTEQIRHVHRVSRETCGSPRVHAELVDQGHRCNRKTVARCMQQAGIQAKAHRRFRMTTTDSNHPHPVAENLVNRNFQPAQKNEI